MLEIRPNCEACDIDLTPDSGDAYICTYECTFCSDCVTNLLNNVCPNCGGGFCPRPIRPQQARRVGVSLQYQPASQERISSNYTHAEIREFALTTSAIEPKNR